MKRAFYTYWLVYLIIMAVSLSGLSAPLWVAEGVKILFFLSYVYLAGYPMYFMYVHQRRVDDIEERYLEGIIVSFIVRSLLWVCASYGLKDRWELLTFFGGGMLFYYIFEIRIKLKRIEKYIY